MRRPLRRFEERSRDRSSLTKPLTEPRTSTMDQPEPSGCAYVDRAGYTFHEGFDVAPSRAAAPADTAMMGIVHSALRRDLTRTSRR